MKESLTPAEWVVMRALWEKNPATLSEVIAKIGDGPSWSYKTFSAYLAILEKKGFVAADRRGRDKFYYPVATREECVEREGRNVLEKIEAGSVGLMVTSMVRAGNLGADERRALLTELEKLIEQEARDEGDD